MSEVSKVINTHTLLGSLCDSWMRRIRASEASRDRKEFMETGSMCNQFFAGSLGFMWEDNFRERYLGGMPSPKFKITIAKAFELVTLFGPSVMWDYGSRVSKITPAVELPRLAFGPEDDEQAEMAYEQHLSGLELDRQKAQARCSLMDRMLNYLQREQPHGGLIGQANSAITDAIVRGRGCMHTGTYQFPGSNRKMVRTTFFPVTDLYIDPDARDPHLADCYWIARKRCDKYWNVERKFKLPKDSLKKHCNGASIASTSMNSGADKNNARLRGAHNDEIIYYEIWSKEGVGIRTIDSWGNSKVNETLEEVVGDHAYLAICEDVPYPLNFPPHLMKVADDDQVKAAFEWEIPFYTDGRWPVSFLDFHRRPDCAWPIAPMAMGLGELTILNVVMSVLAERCVAACRTNIVASNSLGAEILSTLKNVTFSGVTEIPDDLLKAAGGSVQNLINYLEAPPVQADVFRIIDMIVDMFERRTGLVDLMYGAHAGGKVDRSATDSANKQQAVSIRPDWMGRSAEQWLTDIANNERIAAGWTMPGTDWVELLGSDGARMWDMLIYEEDPEVFVRQMKTTLEANSIKKPNKFRDNQNFQATVSIVLPILQAHWQQSGDPRPLNEYLKAMAEAMDQDATTWMLPEIDPGPSEEELAAQQQAAELEQEKQSLALDSTRENLRGKQLRNSKLEQEVSPPAPLEAMGMSPMAELPPELAMMQGMPPEMMPPPELAMPPQMPPGIEPPLM